MEIYKIISHIDGFRIGGKHVVSFDVFAENEKEAFKIAQETVDEDSKEYVWHAVLDKEPMNINMFLTFCYGFPWDFSERMQKHYGHLGDHFVTKWQGFTKQYNNNFVGMIYMYRDMTHGHQRTFQKLIEEYNAE